MPVKLESVTDEQDEQLPEPNRSLSKSVSTKVIKLANIEGKSDKYCWCPVTLCTILPPLLMNIKQIEGTFLPTIYRVPSITFLVAIAYGLCEFPVSYSRGMSLSDKEIIACRLVVMIASNHWIYTEHISCHFTLSSLTIFINYQLLYM